MPRHRGHKVVRTVLGNVHPDSLRRSAPPHWQDAPLLPVQVVRQGALRRQCGGVERLMIYLTTGGLSNVCKGAGLGTVHSSPGAPAHGPASAITLITTPKNRKTGSATHNRKYTCIKPKPKAPIVAIWLKS